MAADSEDKGSDSPAGAAQFANTHWSVVLSAADKQNPTRALASLEKLCRVYWHPLYFYARREGASPHDAQDLTQEFFARLLEKDLLDSVDRRKGRFRSFLLAAFKHFLSNERDKARAQKRGGGQVPIPIDAQNAETQYGFQPVEQMTAEKIFERRWAMSLLEQTAARLREEYERDGKTQLFEQIKVTLSASGLGASLKFVRVDSEGSGSEGAHAVDGKPTTIWHTQWVEDSPGLPHEIIIELIPPSIIKGFTYLPRQDTWDNGNIKDYEFYGGDDGENFGQPLSKGSFKAGKEKKITTFPPVKCRFIKLKALSEIGGRPYTSAAEIDVIQNGEDASAKAIPEEKAVNNEAAPVIALANVPLTSAISALALQAGLNIIFDPALIHMDPPPNVNEKWRQVTALQALQALLDNYGWQMTKDPGTPIFRIGAMEPNTIGSLRKTVNLLEGAPTNGDQATPVIVFDGVPFLDAIRALAVQAGLNIQFDPRLASRQDAPKVTAKWVNVTARQALQAFLDNWRLEMTQLPGNPICRIAAKNP